MECSLSFAQLVLHHSTPELPLRRKPAYRRNCPATTLTNLLINLKPFTPNQKYFFTCQYVHVYIYIHIIRICFKKRLCMHLHIHFLCTCNILLTIPQFYGKWFTIDSGPVLHQVASRRASDAGDVADITARFLGCPKHVHRKMATAIGKDMQDKSHLKFICLVVFTVITWSLFDLFCIYRFTTVVLEHRSMFEL